MKHKLILLNGDLQTFNELDFLIISELHEPIEKTILVATLALGLIHRKIHVLHQ
ncbi:hypothetical protein [Vibrio vulnificus YJ016]|uniref:Uncharacterized protein n=1 Tax=Vibrio vulnificus (strain YJ016) TaxID=196600 RepID=Q7MQJ1_VIBVY|nr:hypothetical protein [Vibrio vulnificus YJ016]